MFRERHAARGVGGPQQLIPLPRPTRPASSLRRRLPLLISALLCVVVTVVCGLAHRELEHALIITAGERVTGATRQLARMLTESAQQQRAESGRLATDSTIARFAARRTPETALAARELLTRLASRSVGKATIYAVVDRSGRPLLLVGDSARAAASAAMAGKALAAGDVAWARPLRLVDGNTAVTIVSPIRTSSGGRSVALGYLVEQRQMATSGVESIRALIGRDAALRFGNARGDFWTDLTKPVVGPAVVLPPIVPTEYTLAGRRMIGTMVPVTTTPWAVVVEMPTEAALAPARQFLLRIAAAAFGVVLLGAIGAWMVSRQFTAPLGEVSRAAEGFALGDYTRRVAVTRDDELGSLFMSFNTMATQVETRARELEATNEELRESELRYRRLIELAPYGILVHDGHEVLYGNAALGALLGADSTIDVVGRPVLACIHPDDHDAMREHIARSVVAGLASPLVEQRWLRLDGTPVDVEAVGIPFTYRGRPAAQVVVHDVGERKRLEAQMRQAQKMEAVGQLAGGVAHDFNNLLTVITSYSAMLLTDLPAGEAHADIQEIRRAADRASALTRQLLAFSRQQVLDPMLLDLNDTAREMERLLGRLVREDIRVIMSLGTNLGLVFADAGQIEQVLVNLVVNARDAMPNGGTVTIETANVELDAAGGQLSPDVRPGRYLMLAVSDTGVGMDAATQARIFEPFFTTKRVGEGTGLGLATVYGIVKQSGGHVLVYSEPGVGTSFKVYLPRAEEAAVAVLSSYTIGPPNASIGRSGGETILLAEDEAGVRAATRRILERAGYRVIEAIDGADALRLSKDASLALDLLITDMVMPQLNGGELAAQVRRLRPEMPVLFMSGYTDEAVRHHGLLAAGTRFLQKPFTPEALCARVEAALLSSRPAPRTAV